MNDCQALLAANAAYYRAFQAGDYVAMAAVWADEDVSCIHPGWQLIEGRAEVLESYRRILANPAQEPVTSSQEQIIISGDMARVLCVETVAGGMLAATNLFIRADGTWRLVHHHASPIAVPVSPPPPRRLN
jgi:ketosteroid isomerase-like protein